MYDRYKYINFYIELYKIISHNEWRSVVCLPLVLAAVNLVQIIWYHLQRVVDFGNVSSGTWVSMLSTMYLDFVVCNRLHENTRRTWFDVGFNWFRDYALIWLRFTRTSLWTRGTSVAAASHHNVFSIARFSRAFWWSSWRSFLFVPLCLHDSFRFNSVLCNVWTIRFITLSLIKYIFIKYYLSLVSLTHGYILLLLY